MESTLLGSQNLHIALAQKNSRGIKQSTNRCYRVLKMPLGRITSIMLVLSLMFGCSSSAVPYPTTSSNQRTLYTRDDASWLAGTLHVVLGDIEWKDCENYYILKSTVYFTNRSERNIYYLREDLSEPSFLLENVDRRKPVSQIFSGTRPPAQSEFWSKSLMCSVPRGEFKAAVEWNCWPIFDELGLHFRISDYVVPAGTDVQMSYLFQSAISSSLIQISSEPTYVDMWSLANDPKNSFQTDSRSEWVTVTFPDKEPSGMKKHGKDNVSP